MRSFETSSIYDTKTGFHRIFGRDASFWKSVDINWLYSPGKKILGESQPEDSVDDPFALKKENQRLRQLLIESIARQRELQDEATRLRAAIESAVKIIDNLEASAKPGAEKSSKLTLNDAYKLLGLDDNHDPRLASSVIDELSRLLHPDSLMPRLEREGKPKQTVDSTIKAAERLLTQVNNAKNTIRAATPRPKPQP